MDVAPSHFHEAGPEDRVEVPIGRPVIKNGRRVGPLERKFDVCRVSLFGAEVSTEVVERGPPLVAGRDDLISFGEGDAGPVGGRSHSHELGIHRDPPARFVRLPVFGGLGGGTC